MRSASLSDQNQLKNSRKKKIKRSISLMNIDAQSCKKAEFNNILKGSYTMIKWDLTQGCKDFSISTNQSVGYTTLTN